MRTRTTVYTFLYCKLIYLSCTYLYLLAFINVGMHLPTNYLSSLMTIIVQQWYYHFFYIVFWSFSTIFLCYFYTFYTSSIFTLILNYLFKFVPVFCLKSEHQFLHRTPRMKYMILDIIFINGFILLTLTPTFFILACARDGIFFL